MSGVSPYRAAEIAVREEWLDYNGHVTDSAYSLICSLANEAFLEHLGLSAGYLVSTGCTTYTVESHLRFLAEVDRGAVLHADVVLVDADAKRLHVHTTVLDGDEAVLTGEYLYLHVDQATGRVTPFPPDRAAAVEAQRAAHESLPRPTHLGHGVGAPRS